MFLCLDSGIKQSQELSFFVAGGAECFLFNTGAICYTSGALRAGVAATAVSQIGRSRTQLDMGRLAFPV